MKRRYKDEKIEIGMNDGIAIRSLITHAFSLKISRARRRRT